MARLRILNTERSGPRRKADIVMAESVQHAVEQHSQPEDEESGTWQTPDYAVVETALEVTAYSLSSR